MPSFPRFHTRIPGDPLWLVRLSLKITDIWGLGKNLRTIFKINIQNKTVKENKHISLGNSALID